YCCVLQGMAEKVPYPGWAMGVSVVLLCGGFLPIPIVYFMRRLQFVRYDTDIHQASIKRVETTISTTGMIKSEELPRPDSGVWTIYKSSLSFLEGIVYETKE
ncbi:unnamed protein product, partial [Meganyctiphanes norvegica]